MNPCTPGTLVVLLLSSTPALAQQVQQETGPPLRPSELYELKLLDRFSRDVTERELALVDWDGYLANPAIEFFVCPPEGATYPAMIRLSANGERLYFDDDPQGGSVGPSGPSRLLTRNDATPASVLLSIFPDRDGLDERYQLTVEFEDATGWRSVKRLPIDVLDQDVGSLPQHTIHVDFSEDQSGFFQGSQEVDILRQAVEDWAYLIADMNLDIVPLGAESTWIWNYPEGFHIPGNGHFTQNASAYEGFLLYAYGLDTPLLRSGGEPGLCCFQSSGGGGLPLRRSGGVEIEVKGNFNTLGWFLTNGDQDWHSSKNLAQEPNDLYSIAHHEIGHALFANSAYPNFAAAEALGAFMDPELTAYFGGAVPVDPAFDHFPGVVDPASLRGVFGNEYSGSVPARRWLITKLDLLLLQAIGYDLRATSSLQPLSITTTSLASGTVAVPYSDTVLAMGGIPTYDWELVQGQLPPGIRLDRFSGTLSGTPTSSGNFAFTVRVRDEASSSGATLSTNIDIQ